MEALGNCSVCHRPLNPALISSIKFLNTPYGIIHVETAIMQCIQK